MASVRPYAEGGAKRGDRPAHAEGVDVAKNA